jgi:C-8 sterol isomerase
MHYIFEPDALKLIVQQSLGLPLKELVAKVRAELTRSFPNHICQQPQWLFSNAGGGMCSILILHASLKEYILIFGTPVGTSGHTGRHWVEFHDFVLDGEYWYYDEDKPLDRLVHKPGDYFHLPKGQSQGFHIPSHAWALEYARGPLMTLVPFGMADTVFSTHDFRTALKTQWVYGRQMLKELFLGRS